MFAIRRKALEATSDCQQQVSKQMSSVARTVNINKHSTSYEDAQFDVDRVCAFISN